MATLVDRRPTFDEETVLIERGYSLVAGLDEVGRGPLAGPVVAGVAILPPDLEPDLAARINDSKQLTPKQRRDVLGPLREAALGLETGASSAREIDDIGIVRATRLAMRRALDNLLLTPHFLLLDAFPLPEVSIPQKPIIRGDALCLSIAAASIVAKVTRDRVMAEADAKYPGYRFASNKGYASSYHLSVLETKGPCPIHRFSFSPMRLRDEAR